MKQSSLGFTVLEPYSIWLVVPMVISLVFFGAAWGGGAQEEPAAVREGDRGLAAKYPGDVGIGKDPAVLLHEDFESGKLSQWDVAVPKAQVVADPTGRRSGKVLHIPYDVPEGAPAHRDCNRFVQKNMSTHGIEHFFIRGYFYLTPSNRLTFGKKLFYIWCDPQATPRWDIVVSAYDNGKGLALAFGSNVYEHTELRFPTWDIARGKVFVDKWYCLELEIKLNAPGKKDAEARLWLDGEMVMERTGVTIRADKKPLGIVRVGAQIDRNGDTNERHEDRYWDDVVIAKKRIGQMIPAEAKASERDRGK